MLVAGIEIGAIVELVEAHFSNRVDAIHDVDRRGFHTDRLRSFLALVAGQDPSVARRNDGLDHPQQADRALEGLEGVIFQEARVVGRRRQATERVARVKHIGSYPRSRAMAAR